MKDILKDITKKASSSFIIHKGAEDPNKNNQFKTTERGKATPETSLCNNSGKSTFK